MHLFVALLLASQQQAGPPNCQQSTAIAIMSQLELEEKQPCLSSDCQFIDLQETELEDPNR
jgi:hypothetical protein